MTTPGEFYDWLRTANPHLPPSDTVIGSTPAELTFGPDTMTTITITVMVELPGRRPSMTRPEWVEAGARAICGIAPGKCPNWDEHLEQATHIIAAVEPLLRADERNLRDAARIARGES